MLRLTLISAVLTAGSTVSAAGPHPSLPSATVPDGLGVNIHFIDAQPGELDMLAKAGFRWIRMDFNWASTEKHRGQYDFAAYDRLVSGLESRHLKAIFILDYGNPIYDPNESVVTKAARDAFGRWAASAAVHFRGHGILWEIWNEPNGGFWKPQADVKQYVALALVTAKAIHKAAPGEAIIGPATAHVDFRFLESCFQAGLLNWWDAVSVHPYRQTGPESVSAEYAKLRQMIAHYAPRGKHIPVLSGEWGYSSTWDGYDDAKQGRMLAREWLMNLANHIPVSIWYDWHDDGPDPREPEYHFGSVRYEYLVDGSPVYRPKPAYLAAKTLTSTLAGFQFDKRLKLSREDDYALVFRKHDHRCIVVWSTSADRHLVRIPSSAGKFEVVNHTGDKGKPIVVRTGGSLEVTANDAPQYCLRSGADPVLDAAPTMSP